MIRKKQFEFRKESSYVRNLLSFYTRVIDEMQERDRWVDAIYWDKKKAFKKIFHKNHIWKLEHKGRLKGAILKWMKGWLQGREMRTVIRDNSWSWCEVTELMKVIKTKGIVRSYRGISIRLMTGARKGSWNLVQRSDMWWKLGKVRGDFHGNMRWGRDNTEKQKTERLGSNDSRHIVTRKIHQWNIWFYMQLVSKYQGGI